MEEIIDNEYWLDGLKVEKYVIGEEETYITHGSGNVFADLGLDDAKGLFKWRCNCCRTEFYSEQYDRSDDGSGNGGAKCPCCKADGQFTYRKHSKPVEKLKSVLCDPEGKCCISGSNADRQVVDEALAILDQQAAHNPWQPIETAPKDRTRVLVSDRYYVDTAYFAKGEWWLYECSDDWYSCSINPTHWMPLPAAPQFDEDKSKHDLSKGE